MTKLVDLGDARKARAEKCMFCGQEEHPTELMCPRVTGVGLDDDGAIITIYLGEPAAPEPHDAA